MTARRRLFRIGLEVAAATMGALALLLVALAWRLSSGPIVLDALTPRIVAALTPPDGSFAVTIGRTELAWAGWARTLDLRATEVRAVNAAGRVLATVPEVSIAFSVRALLRGVVAPSRLEVVAPRLLLSRSQAGRLRFGLLPASDGAAGNGFGGVLGDTGDDTDIVLDTLLDGLMKPADPARVTGYLTSVSVIGGRLLLNDAPSGLVWAVPSLDLVLERDPAGLRVAATAAVMQPNGQTYVSASARLDRQEQRLSGTLSVSGLHPSALAPAAVGQGAGLLAILDALDLPLSGSIAFNSAVDGTGAALDFALRAESGRLLPPGLDGSYPVRFAELRGRLSDGLDALILDEFRLDLDGPTLEAFGAAEGLLGSPSGALTVVVRGMPLDRLEALWPPSVGPNPREWILENLSDGHVEEAQAAFDFSVGGDGRIETTGMLGGLAFAGVTVDYFSPLPPVTGVDGTATFDDARFSLDILGGTIRQDGIGGSASGPVVVPAGHIDITGLEGTDHRIAITVTANGPLNSILEVVDHPLLNYASDMGLDPASISGTALAELSFRFPLIADLQLSQMEIGVDSVLENTAIRDVIGDLDLTDGQLVLDLDKDGMLVEGTGSLADLPLALSWRESFGDGRPQRQLAVSGTVAAESLARFGIDPSPMLSGPLAVSIRGEGDAGRLDLSVTAGLSDATLDLSDIAFVKPAGTGGRLEAVLTLIDGTPSGNAHATLAAGALMAEIPLRFGESGGTLSQVGPAELHLGRSDLTVTATPVPEGGWRVEAAGAVLDLAPLLRDDDVAAPDAGERPAAAVQGAAETAADLTATIDVGTLWLGDTTALSTVTGSLGRQGGRWFSADLAGLAPGGGGVALHLIPGEQGRRLTLSAEDTGALLRTLDLNDSILGGTLRFEGVFDDTRPNSPLSGDLLITDYRVLDIPLLARLLNVASLTGLGDLMSGEGIAFQRAQAHLELEGDRLSIEDGRAYGNALGLTIEGTLDLEAETIDATGTLVPAYSLNAALGNIPILGPLLIGEPGSGVFAATYAVRGALAEPAISVNPVAALAPGFLRNLFGVFGESRDGTPADPRRHDPGYTPGPEPAPGQ